MQNKLFVQQEHLAEERSSALTANRLSDGIWSWKGFCRGWFQLAIGLLAVAILQGIQLRIPQSSAGLVQKVPGPSTAGLVLSVPGQHCWPGTESTSLLGNQGVFAYRHHHLQHQFHRYQNK